jgi:hypothetical protein
MSMCCCPISMYLPKAPAEAGRHRKAYLAAFAFAVLLAAPAHSQSRPAPDTSRASAPHAPEAPGAEPQRKDPKRAVWYSVGGTVLGAPLFGAGLLLGPAAGHFYADNNRRAWVGIGIRTGGALLPILATAGRSGYAGLGAFLVTAPIGGAVILVSAIYDIVVADNAARQHNRAHGLRVSDVRVVPTAGGPMGNQVGLTVEVGL